MRVDEFQPDPAMVAMTRIRDYIRDMFPEEVNRVDYHRVSEVCDLTIELLNRLWRMER